MQHQKSQMKLLPIHTSHIFKLIERLKVFTVYGPGSPDMALYIFTKKNIYAGAN